VSKSNVLLLIAGFGLAGVLTQADQADARPFRPFKVPNYAAVGEECSLCHNTFGGSPRNSFGLDVEALVTPDGEEIFWGPELAALDSDGDGVPNGVELGDPDGTWQEGDPDPGDPATITDPSEVTSFIEQPEPEATAVEASTWALIKGFVQGLTE
jgi:hypothetical protein